MLHEVWGHDLWDVSIGIVLVNVSPMFVIPEIHGIAVPCRSYTNVAKLSNQKSSYMEMLDDDELQITSTYN